MERQKTTTEAEQQTSSKVGRYQLVERVAVGGMAEVFLAVERGSALSLERLVIIKRILPHLAADDRFVRMFFREARVAARINHPNVVQIFELGESDGLPFIAMEYVAGSTLKQLLSAAHRAEVRLPLDVVIHLMVQALDGVHAAHELTDAQGNPAGLVHRDLSPHNLMVTSAAHVKLLDFGIAKATHDLTEQTKTGVLKGKVAYMSPEQCRQDDLDRRSDIFAMGIVAWELFAGQRLFDAKGDLGIMQAIVRGEIKDLRKVRPEVPDAVVNVLERALALDRDARWRTADEMRRALQRAAQIGEVDINPDRAGLLVKTLLGEVHAARAKAVSQAMERTLVTLSTHRLPTASDGGLTGTAELTRTVAANAGWMGAVGLIALLGLASTLILVAGVVVAMGLGPFALTTDDPGGGDAIVHRYAGEPVRIAVGAPVDADQLKAEYEPFRFYLEDALKRPVTFTFHEDYTEARDQLIRGEAAFAALPPKTYIDTKKMDPNIEVIAIKQYDDSSGTDGYIVVQEDSSFRRVTDLEGRTLCHPNATSTTGYALCHAYLRDEGMNPDKDFRHRFSGNHHQVLEDVISGACSAGCTYSGGFITGDENGINVNTLRILAITGRSPHDAFTAGSHTDPALREGVEAALLALDPQKLVGAPRLGNLERVTGFVKGDDSDYDALREVLAEELPAPE